MPLSQAVEATNAKPILPAAASKLLRRGKALRSHNKWRATTLLDAFDYSRRRAHA